MKTRLLFLAAALGAASPAPAESPTSMRPFEAPIVLGTRHLINSPALGEAREINVRLPSSYSDTKANRSYPVLYVLDGGVDQDFPHIAGLAQHGEISGTFDEFIVVGITTTAKRIWELTTPTRDERYITYVRPEGQPARFGTGGGSDRFRRFIAEEAIPFVEAKYRTSGRRTLMGESLAAFFVVDTLLRQPGLFHDYIAVSPSLWWNREELGDRAAAMLKAKDYSDRRLYVTMANEGGTMQRGLDKLLAALRTPAAGALKWTWVDRRHSEHHGSLYHVAALDALRTLYPKPYRPGSPLPWLWIGEMPKLSEAAEADKKMPCTAGRARQATFAEVAADPLKWEALCVISPLGQAPEPREMSKNWDSQP